MINLDTAMKRSSNADELKGVDRPRFRLESVLTADKESAATGAETASTQVHT